MGRSDGPGPTLAPEAEAVCIGPGDVGLRGDEELPFEIVNPARLSPLVISLPHVGLEWPAGLGPRPQVNFARNADLGVDALYAGADERGATLVKARFSRLVIDLNRAADDVSAELVPDHPAPRPRPTLGPSAIDRGGRPIRNRGVVWPSAIGNIPLFTRLSYEGFEERIRRFHAPYHRALSLLLEERRRRFGHAILLDAHSMPGTVGPALVVGTRSGGACGPRVLDAALIALRGTGLTVAIDEPYGGGELVHRFGRPDAGLHALQLEVSRALYMDERRLELWPPLRPDPARLPARPLARAVETTSERAPLATLLACLARLVDALSSPAPGA